LITAVVATVLLANLSAMRYVLSHTTASAAVASGVVVLMIAKHLGAAALFGPLYARFRRR
jgi:hypothetical protein